jgi:homoserine kinase
MEAVLECCCGLDVHRDNVVACILKGTNEQKSEKTIKTFSSLQDGLQKLRAWLEDENCRHAANECKGFIGV